MPNLTFIVRFHCIDGLIEEQEFAHRIDAERFFDIFTHEDNSDVWVSVELVSYDYTHHCETPIMDHCY